MIPRFCCWLLWSASLLLAQDPNVELARALVRAEAASRDDVDARAIDLLTAALAYPKAPLAAIVAGEARNLAEDIGDPAALRAWLAARPRPAGGVGQRIAELDWRLWRRCGGPPAANPFAGYARSLDVIGPFGRGDGPWPDETMPPDAGFPRRGVPVDGRFGKVTVWTRTRAADEHSIALLHPVTGRQGAHFARWRIGAAAEAVGFLEVEYAGSYVLRVDGFELGRVDPVLQPGAQVRRFGLRLAAGEHEIVLKTTDRSQSGLALRLVDAGGGMLDGVRETEPSSAEAAADKPAADPRDPGRFADGLTSLEGAAKAQTGAEAALLRTAAAWVAGRIGEPDRAMSLLLQLQQEPPQEPETRLLLASAWRRVDGWPEELRNSQAREQEDAALKTLPAEHVAALLVRARQLDDKDRGEDALRLLRKAADEGRGGSAVFATIYGVCRRLKFQTELGRVLEQWARACPKDPQPHLRMAQRALELDHPAAALAAFQRALELQPTDSAAQRGVWQQALALGRFELARGMIDRIAPEDAQAPERSLTRARLLLQLAQRSGDADAVRQQLDAIAQHPFAGADEWRSLRDQWLLLADRGRALAACEQGLALDSDQFDALDLRARLGGAAAPGADFARFRHDGDAAVHAFQVAASDGEAPTTVCIDSRITEVLPDGSHVTEVHELRRINDLAGVESLDNARDAANADDLLLLRTIDAKGVSYVPSRVQEGFSMPRLEPGAFVEWRYRSYGAAPGADALQLPVFLLQSQAEPLRLTEYVLILPARSRGELRLRNLPKASRDETLADGRRVLTFRRDDVARLPQESMAPPAEDQVALAAFGEDEPAWPGLRQLRIAMLSRSRPTPPIQQFVEQTCAGAATELEKLQRLHAFLQTEIAEGNAAQATEVLLTKKGDRFLLLLALCRAAGLDVTPAACRAARPELDDSAAPLFQSGSPARMPALVIRPKGSQPVWVFADTPRHFPLGAIPGQRGDTEAWLLGAAPQATRVPAATTSPQDIDATAEATFERDALVAKGSLRLDDLSGYGIADQVRRRTKDVRNVAARQLATQLFDGWRVRSAKLQQLDPGGAPLLLDFEIQNAGLQKDGEGRWLLPVPLPPSKLRDSFGDREERKLPLRLAQDITMRHRIVVDPGEDRAFLELPAPLLVESGPLTYQLTFTFDGRKVAVERFLRVRPTTLPVSHYAEWLRALGAIDRAEKVALPLGRSVR